VNRIKIGGRDNWDRWDRYYPRYGPPPSWYNYYSDAYMWGYPQYAYDLDAAPVLAQPAGCCPEGPREVRAGCLCAAIADAAWPLRPSGENAALCAATAQSHPDAFARGAALYDSTAIDCQAVRGLYT
jgi:hypothetical protein